MEILDEKKMSSGETLRVLHWSSSEKAPEKYVDYVLASMGSDSPHEHLYSISGWRAYFSDAMLGTFYPEVVDHWFFAEVNGECAGRIWFAYSAKSLIGNFGNVMTRPRFQGRGIMTELMKHCMAEIRRSPANMLCCIAGKRITPTYLKNGFSLIHGGEEGPLCFIKEGSFLDKAKQAFSGSSIMEVRPGRIGDQFDCDKFLAYVPELWNRRFPVQTGPAASIFDFRMALQESFSDHAVVYVALNEQKICCGYAFAVMLPSGLPVLDFVIHPAYMADSAELIRTTASAFQKTFGAIPSYYGLSADAEKNTAAVNAGMKRISEVSSAVLYKNQMADMTVFMPEQY